MKCIIYGLSTIRNIIEPYIEDNVEIIGYSDSFAEVEYFNGKKFHRPKELLNIDFDIIIIMIDTFTDCIYVEKKLVNMGIEVEKIIPIYKIKKYISMITQNSSFIDKALNRDLKLDGIIFGISYGADGINPEYLKHKFYNFCRPSQDLYYTLEQIKYIKENYKEKIHNLKYIILDMYTYTYFNYDVSLSKNALNFIYNNGFEKNIHNLNKNKNYSSEHINKISKELDKNTYMILKNIIKSDYIIRKENGYILKENYNILREEDIRRYKIDSLEDNNISRKIYINTEQENIENFDNIINEIFNINPEIKIYLVLIPRYKIKEDKMKSVEHIWKNRFYNILEEFKLKYNFKVLDFKEHEEISAIREYYSDLEHLNCNGAIAFTKLLSNTIE